MLFYGVVFWISVLLAGSIPPLFSPDECSYNCWDDEEEAQVGLAVSCGCNWGSKQMYLLAKDGFFLPPAAGEFTLH